jgi:uncharacterized protein HemY
MVSKPKKFVLGRDVDLKKETVRDLGGKRITQARAQKIVRDALKQTAGRPSLTRPSITSPEVKARVPEKLKKALEKEAKRRGETPSALIRQALEKFLKSA